MPPNNDTNTNKDAPSVAALITILHSNHSKRRQHQLHNTYFELEINNYPYRRWCVLMIVRLIMLHTTPLSLFYFFFLIFIFVGSAAICLSSLAKLAIQPNSTQLLTLCFLQKIVPLRNPLT